MQAGLAQPGSTALSENRIRANEIRAIWGNRNPDLRSDAPANAKGMKGGIA